MLRTTYEFLPVMHSTRWMDERVVTLEKCWNGIEEKMPEISREVNLNEVVEKLTCLNALDGKIWKSDQKIVMDGELVQNDVMDEEVVQNIVMDEELTQKGVMDGKFVKNFVMDVKNDPKVVMDLSKFKIGGWNSLQPINQILLEEFVDEKEPWLLIGISSRDPFLVTQYLERHSVSSDQHMKK